METMSIVIELVLCAIVFFLIEDLIKWYRAKKFFYIEDSRLEQILFKEKVHMDNAKVINFYDLSSALTKMGWMRPDAVIVDYHLPDGKGDEIYRVCERLKIPVRVVTCEQGSIEGIDENKIIHKSPDNSHLDQIKAWLNKYAIA